jgi:signal peptidase I
MPEKDKKSFLAGIDVSREIFEWCQMLTSAVVVVVLLFAFFISMFTVSGPSMEDTLHSGEMLLISRFLYTPKRGDIVMFSKPGLEVSNEETGRQTPFVKRVIAVGGDRLRIVHSENAVYVNDKLLSESYILEPMSSRRYPDIIELTVSEGHVFCMGDNRNNSRDSRELNYVGEIDTRYILGRVLFRLTPLRKIGLVA